MIAVVAGTNPNNLSSGNPISTKPDFLPTVSALTGFNARNSFGTTDAFFVPFLVTNATSSSIKNNLSNAEVSSASSNASIPNETTRPINSQTQSVKTSYFITSATSNLTASNSSSMATASVFSEAKYPTTNRTGLEIRLSTTFFKIPFSESSTFASNTLKSITSSNSALQATSLDTRDQGIFAPAISNQTLAPSTTSNNSNFRSKPFLSSFSSQTKTATSSSESFKTVSLPSTAGTTFGREFLTAQPPNLGSSTAFGLSGLLAQTSDIPTLKTSFFNRTSFLLIPTQSFESIPMSFTQNYHAPTHAKISATQNLVSVQSYTRNLGTPSILGTQLPASSLSDNKNNFSQRTGFATQRQSVSISSMHLTTGKPTSDYQQARSTHTYNKLTTSSHNFNQTNQKIEPVRSTTSSYVIINTTTPKLKKTSLNTMTFRLNSSSTNFFNVSTHAEINSTESTLNIFDHTPRISTKQQFHRQNFTTPQPFRTLLYGANTSSTSSQNLTKSAFTNFLTPITTQFDTPSSNFQLNGTLIQTTQVPTVETIFAAVTSDLLLTNANNSTGSGTSVTQSPMKRQLTTYTIKIGNQHLIHPITSGNSLTTLTAQPTADPNQAIDSTMKTLQRQSVSAQIYKNFSTNSFHSKALNTTPSTKQATQIHTLSSSGSSSSAYSMTATNVNKVWNTATVTSKKQTTYAESFYTPMPSGLNKISTVSSSIINLTTNGPTTSRSIPDTTNRTLASIASSVTPETDPSQTSITVTPKPSTDNNPNLRGGNGYDNEFSNKFLSITNQISAATATDQQTTNITFQTPTHVSKTDVSKTPTQDISLTKRSTESSSIESTTNLTQGMC